MIKLLIVQNYWTPYRHYLFSALAKQPDIQLEVLYLGEVGSDRKWQFRQADFPMFRPKSFRFGPFLFTDISKVPVESYDTIILLEHLENIFTILRLAARAKGNYLLWCGMFENMYPDKPAYGRIVSLFKWLYRPFLYRASHYLAYSSLSRQMLERAGIPYSMITVMPQVALVGEENMSSDSILNVLRQKRQESGGPLQVLSLGYLRLEKNNLSLARVCGRFSSSQIHLTIVGDGPEKEALEAVKGDNVTILDYLDGPEKFARYLASDLFVLPTLRDPWALVVNEAMYCGLPVICSNRAGAKDAIDGNGFVYDPYDEEALFHHVNWFLNHKDQIPIMGKRSKEIIEKTYSVEKAVSVFQDVLSRVNANG